MSSTSPGPRLAWFTLAIGIAACRPSFESIPSERAPVDARVAERIRRVENGLLPAVVIKGKTQAVTLAERLARQTPGLSVAVINDGQIEWARGYGVVERNGGRRVTPDTLFLAGSISKPVAALAALRLVEQGKLGLDEDVNLKLKSWKVPENQFTKEKKVTLRRLLSHSAGLTVHGFPGYSVSARAPTLVQILDGERPANTPAIRVDIVPGSQWRYSGGGYTVVQQLAMDVMGSSFPELARQLVLEPLGMRQSTFENPLPKSLEASAATAHGFDGKVVEGRWHVYPEMAAAGLWTTASDLARYAIEVQRALEGRSTILSREMAQQMLTVQMGRSGLGPALENADKESARFGHGGVDEGFDAILTAYSGSGRGAVVMMNANGAMSVGHELIRAIAREYDWPDYLLPERTPAKVDTAVYERYAGSYKLDPGFLVTVTAEAGRLFAEGGPWGSKVELFPESETSFFSDNGVEHRFELDASGTASGVVVEQGGRTLHGKKLQ